MKVFIIYLLFIVSFTRICLGGDFRYLRTSEGMYNGEINAVAQDKSGKMWFATWAGITSYNGYDFQFFKPELGNPLSLPDKKVNSIFIDSKDNIWVSTLSGISVFRQSDQTFHTVLLEGLEKVKYYVFRICESKGHVIFHTNAGIFLLQNASDDLAHCRAKRLFLFEGTAKSQAYVHYMDTYQDKLLLTSNADSYNPTRLVLSELEINDRDTLIRIQNIIISKENIQTSVYSDKEHKIYLGTQAGMFELALETNRLGESTFFNAINIERLCLTSNQKLFASSPGPTLHFIDLVSKQTGTYLPDPMKTGSLLDDFITSLFADYSGNLWVGHQGQGLSILNLNQKEFHTFRRDPSNPKSMSGNIVMCFNGTKSELFVGLRQSGINLFSKNLEKNQKEGFQLITYKGQPKSTSGFDRIWDIARESDSIFWVGSDGGLAKLQKTRNGWVYGTVGENPVYTNGTVRKVMVDKSGNIWFGTGNSGLFFLPALRKNPAGKYFQYAPNPDDPKSLSDGVIISMLLDRKNHFWIGTNNGLHLVTKSYSELDLSGNTKPDIQFKRYFADSPKKNYLNANEINCIYEDSDGKLWIATQGGGINILDTSSDNFSQLTTETGLPGNDVLGILPGKGSVKWISTNKGIVAVDLKNESKPFVYFNPSDGIQGSTFKVNSWFQSADGEMFFGGDNGFTRFYPEEIKFNPIPPRIGLTNLRIYNYGNTLVQVGDTISRNNIMQTSLNSLDHLILPYSKNSFSIGVGVQHFQFPEGNKIKYKLDGYIDRWITVPATSSNVYFTELPDGSYTLHISALSADNVEAETQRTLSITILPPWYKTWYFRFALFILFLALVSYAIQYMNGRQRLAFQKKLDAVTFESNENKMRFLTNIAHELRTPLSLVIAPIEDMMQNYTEIDKKWKNHLTLIYRNSNYLLTLINQIIDFRKLNAGKLQLNLQPTDIVFLVDEVVSNFKGLESRRKTKLQTELPKQSLWVEIDRQKIEEVLYNLLSNAFKHTGESGTIDVSLTFTAKSGEGTSDQIRISVFNEGKDISDEDKIKIFERFYKVSEKVDGAGIGLSFSKSLVEMHHGNILVESVAGRGVVFHVDLPFDTVQYAPPAEIRNTIEQPDTAVKDDTGQSEPVIKARENTLVIVEDNLDLRTFLKNALSEIYICHEAGDGKEGYELISKIIPDIVISDVVMPRMDGYEMCKKIKDNGKTCHIPVILLTANNATDHVIAGYETGADAYVTKPFDMSIIKAQISRLIRNRELIREKYLTQNFMVEVSNSSLSKDDEFIVKLRQMLESNLSETDFNVARLSSDMNISTTHLYRKLKALTGLSPVEFIRVFKLQKACELLNNTNYSIKEIGYGLGFNNLSYFVKCFREQFGVTPSSFRQKGLPSKSKNDSTNQSEMS